MTKRKGERNDKQKNYNILKVLSTMKRKDHRRLWLIFDRALAQNLLRQLVILCMALIAALGLSYLFLSWSGTQWEDFCKAEHINKYLSSG